MNQQAEQAGYDQQTLESFRVELLKQRVMVLSALQRRNGPALVEELNGADSMDRAQVLHQNIEQKVFHEQELLDIDEALSRIKAETYGCCQGCKKPIPLRRLIAIPTAKRCVACQAAKEPSLRNSRGY